MCLAMTLLPVPVLPGPARLVRVLVIKAPSVLHTGRILCGPVRQPILTLPALRVSVAPPGFR